MPIKIDKPIKSHTVPPVKEPAIKITKTKAPDGQYVYNFTGDDTYRTHDPFAVQTGQETYKYAQAALHPAAALGLKFLVDGPFWVPFSFHPQNDYDEHPGFEPWDELLIQQMNRQIDELDYEDFTQTLKAILYDSLVYGFSVAEMNYISDGEFTSLSSIKTFSPHLFEIRTNRADSLSSLFYRNSGQIIHQPLLNEKFIISTYPVLTHGKYYGTSIIQSIYFDIQMIEILERAQAEGVRANTSRPVVHHYLSTNMDDDALKKTQQDIFDLDSNSLISLPGMLDEKGQIHPNHMLSVLEDRYSAQGLGLIKNILDMLYKRVNRHLGLPDDLGFSSVTVGSLAKADVEFNLYTQTIVNTQGFVERVVNRRIVPAMIRYNYPSLIRNRQYKLPQFKFDTVEEDALTEHLDQVIKMVDNVGGQREPILDLGNDQARDFVNKKLGLPEFKKEVGDSELPKPQPESKSFMRKIFGGKK